MLALLLERTVERRLKGAHGNDLTAEAVFELLSNVHLNRLQGPDRTTAAYVLTRPTPEQLHVVERLGLARLVDEEAVVETIAPR